MSIRPTVDAVPPSPRQLLRPSFAIPDAISGFMAFSSISAASFDAITGPSQTQRPSATSSHAAPFRSRYYTRSSIRLADKENDTNKSPGEEIPVAGGRSRLPEIASRTLHNGRMLRERRSVESNPTDSVAALSNIELGAPSLSSTPSRSHVATDLRRSCLRTNAQKNLEDLRSNGYDFCGADELGDVEQVFRRISASVSEDVEAGHDSTIVLDDTPEDDGVFRFLASTEERSVTADESNDSVIILTSPVQNESAENDEELLDKSLNLDDSLRVLRHKIKRVCPITKKPFINPVVNNRCNHVYDRVAIMAMYSARRANGKLCPCPVAGCDQKVFLFDLKRP